MVTEGDLARSLVGVLSGVPDRLPAGAASNPGVNHVCAVESRGESGEAAAEASSV